MIRHLDEFKNAGELKNYLKDIPDDVPIVDIDTQKLFTMQYNNILYIVIFRMYLGKLKKLIRGLFSLDEERVSTLVLLLILTWILGMFYQFTTNKIPTDLSNVIVALVYGVALAGGSKIVSRYIHPKIKL
jgi:hypothetical protein